MSCCFGPHLQSRPHVTNLLDTPSQVARLDENVISNEDLLLSIHDQHEEPAIVGASLLAIGIRRLRDAFDQCERLLDSEHQIVRLNAAIAVLHLNPTKEDQVPCPQYMSPKTNQPPTKKTESIHPCSPI